MQAVCDYYGTLSVGNYSTQLLYLLLFEDIIVYKHIGYNGYIIYGEPYFKKVVV